MIFQVVAQNPGVQLSQIPTATDNIETGTRKKKNITPPSIPASSSSSSQNSSSGFKLTDLDRTQVNYLNTSFDASIDNRRDLNPKQKTDAKKEFREQTTLDGKMHVAERYGVLKEFMRTLEEVRESWLNRLHEMESKEENRIARFMDYITEVQSRVKNTNPGQAEDTSWTKPSSEGKA